MTSDQAQASSSVMEDRVNESRQTGAHSANSEAFAELNRLARESTSSWSEEAPGHKTDRAFLLLIVIAIILLSGLTMIASYREQLSEKFEQLMARTSQLATVDTATDNRVPVQPSGNDSAVTTDAPTTSELEKKVKSLEQRLALLQHKLDMLETGTPASRTASPDASVSVSRVELDAARPPPKSGLVPSDAGTKQTQTSAAQSPAEVAASAITEMPGANNWYINLAAYSRRSSAKPLLERARQIADADIQEVKSGAGTVYRVRAIGYPSPGEARKDARRLESSLGLKDTWISNK